jgi:hypothetical protein
MLIEQAFCALPEILCGTSYPKHEYEGGLVSAFTMAILQELNGRNVANPLSCLQSEHLYWKRDEASRFDNRYLRADLVVKLASLSQGNTRISSYGWRDENWLEAKFFRTSGRTSSSNPKKATNALINTLDLLVDVIRLATLIKESPNSSSQTARYLLHVYDAAPRAYVALARNTGANASGSSSVASVTSAFTDDDSDEAEEDEVGSTSPRKARTWLQSLYVNGSQTYVLALARRASEGLIAEGGRRAGQDSA